MRGSKHNKEIREFTIDHEGMHLGRPFFNVTGILAGTPVHVSPSDIEQIWTAIERENAADSGAGQFNAKTPKS
jgi:circadian clock protein KaiC